jgi:hypothetical protein
MELIGPRAATASAVIDWMAHGRWPLVLAVLVGLLNLLGMPATQPSDGERSERHPGVAAFGRWLSGLLWVARAATFAYLTYSITNNADQTSFQARSAIVAGAAQAFVLLLAVARHLAGFVVEWKFVRGLNALRYLLRIATGVLLAGYAGMLADVVGIVVPWVPSHVYRLLDRWLWSWVAAPLTGVTSLVLVLVIVLVEGLLQSGAAHLLGRGNALGAWLVKHAPARLVLTDDAYFFEYRFMADISWHGRRRRRPIGRRARQRLAHHEQLLRPDERQALVDRVADVLWADVPPRWTNASLTYRAAGSHEELEFRVNVMGPPDERGVSLGEARESRLTSFVEVESLRRLRAADYEAGMGTPFQWELAFSEADRWSRDDSVRSPRGPASWRPSRSYDELAWFASPTDSLQEPAWLEPPTRADYRDDLRRFPIIRRMRPGWLRERLSREAPVPTDVELLPMGDRELTS